MFLAGAIYLPGISKYLILKQKEKKLEEDISRLKKQVRALNDEEQLLRTNLSRLEEVVREELGLVKPGEMVYKIVEEKEASEDSQNEPIKKAAEEKQPVKPSPPQ
ncbi:MAG: hypothetical protein A3G33_01150 [Omnitrophica bacterium RIFCSPLOWO2_12_FULL_44_17]|uniref:Cell division protein FtsB n=1 Tax=Candidatus Danuiimicrobium aquiferis TaxID=1801832 RepID=A0A1G1L0Y0_9BACT|nr:MAG: hypothetical protein A3B72_02465 [Omnitrophica bacterium RIFCSPHIGHO2_02_FULL_45_28]OGW98796.1 MAG: hypothetical protein A3G33_01150 [Omnitrophica bacterium RIFCSPLOWO2_12_FULL_44_17]OGX02502.1 MAG: hypothetical protein A3J12_00260 [Omnitrophica bacterium RIFCSPLOWO2_02_FULL_44_11]